jgi:hypothetical protein
MDLKAALLATLAGGSFLFLTACGGGGDGGGGGSSPGSQPQQSPPASEPQQSPPASEPQQLPPASQAPCFTSADDAASSSNFVVAPQLVVAHSGPVTFTLVGWAISGNEFPGISLITSSDLNFANPVASLHGIDLGLGLPNAPRTDSFAGLSAGSDFTLSAQFSAGVGANGLLNLVNSTTGATPAVAALLRLPAIFGTQTLLFNAGVIQTGPSSVLIGFSFSPSGTVPSTFGGFALRIAASNVTLSGGGCSGV